VGRNGIGQCLSSFPSAAELREVCCRVKAAALLPEMTAGLHASAWYDDAIRRVTPGKGWPCWWSMATPAWTRMARPGLGARTHAGPRWRMNAAYPRKRARPVDDFQPVL